MQFFSADPRFENSRLGSFIPAISVININNTIQMVVKMQLTDDEDDARHFPVPDIGKIKNFRLQIL